MHLALVDSTDTCERLRVIGQQMAREAGEAMLLVKVPPSKREYTNVLPYLTWLKEASCAEKALLERGSCDVEMIES